MKKYSKPWRITAWILVLLFVIALASIIFSGCNVQMVDTHWKFERAIIFLPDGSTIEGKVSSWRDFEDGDQLQITMDGKTYLTHASNVILIDD